MILFSCAGTEYWTGLKNLTLKLINISLNVAE